jgi:hypothetical protein
VQVGPSKKGAAMPLLRNQGTIELVDCREEEVRLWEFRVMTISKGRVVMGKVASMRATKITRLGWENEGCGGGLSREKKAYPGNLLILGSLAKGQIAPTRVPVSYPPGAINRVSYMS